MVFSFFGPNLGTRNAKNPIGPFKVLKCNQKQLDSKKIMPSKWLLRALKVVRLKMLTSAKIT